MKRAIIAISASVLLLAGCAEVASTILDIRHKADSVSEDVVRNSVEGARAYCGAVSEQRRMQFRRLTDVAGRGPVIEVHCGNL